MVGLRGGPERIGLVVVFAFAGAAGACDSHGATGGNVTTTPDGGMTVGGDGGSSPSERPAPAFPIFDTGRMHKVALTMSPDDWQSILDDSRGDEERHATLTYDGVVIEDVGVHPSGETSRFAGNPKMSVRIKFDAFAGRGKVRRPRRDQAQGAVGRPIA